MSSSSSSHGLTLFSFLWSLEKVFLSPGILRTEKGSLVGPEYTHSGFNVELTALISRQQDVKTILKKLQNTQCSYKCDPESKIPISLQYGKPRMKNSTSLSVPAYQKSILSCIQESLFFQLNL